MDPGKHKKWTRVGKLRLVACMVIMESRLDIWSLNGDNTHSWVRISHGSNKFVMDSNNNDTEVPEDQLEEHALQLDAKDFACSIKGKSKTIKKETCWLFTKDHPDEQKELDWYWTRGNTRSLSAYDVSKKVIHLLRHSQQVHREEDGAVHFWRIKENLQNKFPESIHWSDDRWKAYFSSRRRSKKEISVLHWWFRNNCLFPSSSRTFRTQSYWSFITGQCCDSEQLLPTYLPHWMCVQSSFYHQLWINTWRSGIQARDRQYSFCLLIPRDKEHKYPDKIDLNVPRRAQYLHNAWKRHPKTRYIGSDINLAIRKGLTFYQTRSNAIISPKNTSSLLYSKSC